MRTKEITISTFSFIIFYILVSQFILPVMYVKKQPVVMAGWISLILQAVAVVYLYKKNYKSATVVGIVFIGLQLLIQIIPFFVRI